MARWKIWPQVSSLRHNNLVLLSTCLSMDVRGCQKLRPSGELRQSMGVGADVGGSTQKSRMEDVFQSFLSLMGDARSSFVLRLQHFGNVGVRRRRSAIRLHSFLQRLLN